MKGLYTVVGAVVTFATTLVVFGLWRAWILMQIWGWFLVPLFHLPPLRLVGAYGLCLITSFLFHRVDPDVEVIERSVSYRIARFVGIGILGPAATLLFGWVAHFFV